jgi:hypothetical protein
MLPRLLAPARVAVAASGLSSDAAGPHLRDEQVLLVRDEVLLLAASPCRGSDQVSRP